MPDPLCPQCGAPLPPDGVCAGCVARAADAAPQATTRQSPSSVLERPDRIDVYKILDTLGEGGMGIVYLAEQERPLRRRVALKVIKVGMDTKEVIARFEAERQALALMDHPNIAHIYDAGVTEDGRPYFAMEHVPGIPITSYCDGQRLTNRARLELFIPVCEALHHAHQKGVVHRDVKPSNLLVSIQDGRPVSRIIDFGIAKALNQRLAEATVFTQLGLLIGTPEYMSPEQAGLSALDIDTTSDVYSLGVVLYELLVGALPFDAARLRRAGYDEIRRIIREEEVVRPSTRLTRMGLEANDVAGRHQTDRRTLYRELRGDLDWLTLKAMEKDRTRRYASASEFAADVRRYLSDEPVIARPPTPAYRLQKLVKRRRGAVLAVLSLIVALGLGFATSLLLYARARAATARAQQEAYVATIRAADLSLRSGDLEETRRRLELAGPGLRGWEWGHLASRLDSSTRVLQAGNPLSHVAFSEGDRLAAIGQGSMVGLITQGSGFPENSWRSLAWPGAADSPDRDVGPTDAPGVVSVVLAASADGKLLLADDQVFVPPTVKLGETIHFKFKESVRRIYDRQSGSRLRDLGGPTTALPLIAAAFSPDGGTVVVAADLGPSPELRQWNVTAGTSLLLPLPAESREAGNPCIAFGPEHTHLAYGAGGSIYLFRGGRFRRLGSETQGPGLRCTLTFSPDGSLLFSITSSETGHTQGRLWETSSGQLLGLTEGRWWTAASFSPDGRTIAVGGRDGRIQIIAPPRFDRFPDVGQPAASSSFFGHRGTVRALAFSPDGGKLASGSDDRTVRLWDTASTGEYRAFRVPRRAGDVIMGPGVSRGGSRMASAHGRVVRVWEGSPSGVLASTAEHGTQVTSIALSVAGSRLVTGTADGQVRVWSVGDPAPLMAFTAHKGTVNAVAIDPEGSFVVSGGTERTVRVWDTRSRRELGALEGHTGPVTALATDPEGRLIISGSDDQSVRIWSARDRRLIRTLIGHNGAITSLAVSHDGTRVLSSSADRTIRVWSLSSGDALAVLRGHSNLVTSAVFNADSTRIASGSIDRTVRMWDSALGVPLLTLSNGEELVSSVQFTADGSRLVSASYEGTLRIWESSAAPISAK